MEKNYQKNFQKKLKSYSALAGTIFATVNSADAQVVYTDINPDVTRNTDGASYNLDLNNDGTFDFIFRLTIEPASSSYPSFNKVGITPLNSNAVAGSVSSPYIYPFAMNSGDTVKAALTWNTGSSQSMGSNFGAGYTYGNWAGASDKYVGLRINVAGSIYYGWARLDVNSTTTEFTIKDYAYRNAADPIAAGDMTTGISQHIIPNNVSIYTNQKTIHVSSESSSEAVISVINIAGQKIHEQKMNGGSIEIQLDQANAGIYLVSIRQDGYVYTKKVNLQ